jgi:hypothetical protein
MMKLPTFAHEKKHRCNDMRRICLCLLAMLFVTALFAKKRTQAEAEMLAASFCSSHISLRNAPAGQTLTLAYACTDDDGVVLRTTAAEAYYYIFNVGDGGGFIIISGDDRTDDVLGYTVGGRFDYGAIPSNFKRWLELYRQGLKQLGDDPQDVYGIYEFADTASFASEIAPLLGQTAWGQREPYNDLCPVIPGTDVHAVTGCVATSMAQIMRYYAWPAKGRGVKNYLTEKHHLRLKVDFSQTAYDWEHMLDTYADRDATEQERSAVATLMYHCGVAAEMNYSYESGAGQQIAAFGMKDHFSYDHGMQLHERYFYTTDEWYYLLKKELNAARPVLYVGGRENLTAHAFLCDGYDRNGLFHFNWGWEGSNDGYYNVSIIEPANMHGYNGGQNVITGVRPITDGNPDEQTQLFVSPRHPLSVAAVSTDRSEDFAISVGIYHTSVSPFTGEIGVGLYGETGRELVAILARDTVDNMSNNISFHIVDTIRLPDAVAAGDYRLLPVSSIDGVCWKPVKNIIMAPTGIKAAVTDSTIAFSQSVTGIANLAIEDLTPPIAEIYANSSDGQFDATIANLGEAEAYTAVIFLLFPEKIPVDEYFNAVKAKPVASQEAVKFIMLYPGEKKTVRYNPTITLPAGNYYLFVLDGTTEVCLNPRNPARVTILPEPALAFTRPASFVHIYNVYGDGDTLSVALKNNGVEFNGYLLVDILKAETREPVNSLKPLPLSLRKNEEKTLEIKLGMQEVIPPGDYTIAMSYALQPSKNGKVFQFTPPEYAALDVSIAEKPVANQHPPSAFAVYADPSSASVRIHSDADILSVTVFAVDGSQRFATRAGRVGDVTLALDRLSPGVYILRCETARAVRVVKFVRR